MQTVNNTTTDQKVSGSTPLGCTTFGAACNVKRWIRLEAWKLRQAMLAGSAVARATAG